MHASGFEGILSSENHFVVEFIPGLHVSPSRCDSEDSVGTYQRLSAASFGPGKLAMGLRYSRWIAWAQWKKSQAPTSKLMIEEADASQSKLEAIVIGTTMGQGLRSGHVSGIQHVLSWT
ncbi:hypothetical protein QTJ16_001916 [Diplocarpon rosae]|uniref:Uncharacterized protein n=1 Tax=Diplocarpon rosae TaxID=946125 RepID=A0AAD9T4P2_9HELO|nr:hypothetical protein QTJ16_001916 [Diplocarpon rosae]